MNTAAIRTLKSRVTQEEAIRTLSSTGFSSFYWRIRSGPLRKIAQAYVPFWLYRVRYELGSATQTRLFALDAVDGSLDLFEFPSVPGGHEIVSLDSRNQIAPALTDQRAEGLLREKALRVIFQQGFFKLRQTGLEIVREPGELYLPYWLGFYGRKGLLHCRVMDAVRRRIEGAKASTFFEQWLAA